MITDGVVRSVCGLCTNGCGILVHLKNGKAIKVEGDPESPISKGKLCSKGLASLDYLYHPNRLKYPLKRIGERGEGRWQQISWDEALDMVASELIKAREHHGTESVAFIMGAVKGLQDTYLARLVNTFGTPNFGTVGHMCYVPTKISSEITCGFMPKPDYDYPPACILVWGTNYAETNIAEHGQMMEALNKGAKLIVIDPRKTELATRANLRLQVRPNSDLALALGMINVIIIEGLHDKNFVEQWTVGFDRLVEHIKEYSPEKVEEITWVPAEVIREAARFYAANKPATIVTRNVIEHNINSFQVGRAITILMAITGNLDVPGGNLQTSPIGIPFWTAPQLVLKDALPMDKWEKRVDAGLKLLPSFDRVTPQSIIKAIIEEDPYPIHAAYIQGCNALLTYCNAWETYRALKKLDFLAVSEMFMTPTAELADVVLPAASYLEFDSVFFAIYYAKAMAQVMQKVAQIGECRSDFEILSGLAKKLGLGKYFWDDTESFLDYYLKPIGLTFREFRQVSIIEGIKRYRKYEVNGFETPSRKVELYSSKLEDWGFDPLPIYYEPPETPFSNPELAREYPLIFTSLKRETFRHSGGKQIPPLRRTNPEPITDIHPETASKLGIEDGDWVYIETKRGRIKQKANLTTSIDPRVVIVDYGWWFPEKEASELYGWAESNVNILTDDRSPYSREVGATNLRGILCKVYKVS